MLLAHYRDEGVGGDTVSCRELRSLADGFSLLETRFVGEVRYAVAGRSSGGWYSLEWVTSTFPNSLTKDTFDISNIGVRTIPGVGIVLRFDATAYARHRSEGQLEELDMIDVQTTVCGRSSNDQRQACFTFLTSSSWTTYALRDTQKDGIAHLERTGAPLRSKLFTARLVVSDDGTIHNEVDTRESAVDPRCYSWKHNVFDWDAI